MLEVETLEGGRLSTGSLVVDLDNVVVQAPLAVSVLEGDVVVDELEKIGDGRVVGQGHVEEDVVLRQAVAPHMYP